MDLKAFLKQNKIKKENRFFKATKSICDEKGEPIEWEIRAISTRENEKLRESCTTQRKNKYGQVQTIVDDNLYLAKLIASSVVFPDLNNKELQDSYGVLTPEDLLREILDNPAEYNALGNFIQDNLQGVDINEQIKTAKN